MRHIVAGHGETGAREPFTETAVPSPTLMKTAPSSAAASSRPVIPVPSAGARTATSSPRDLSALARPRT